MSEQLQVVITGKDGLSRVLAEVARSARSAGDAIESAARDGERGLKRLDAAAEATERSIRTVAAALKQTSADAQTPGPASRDLLAEGARANDAAAYRADLATFNRDAEDAVVTLRELAAGMAEAGRSYQGLLDGLRFEGMGDQANDLEGLEQQTIALAEAQRLAADGATNVARSNWDAIDRVNGATTTLQEQAEATEDLLEIERQRAEFQQQSQRAQDDYWSGTQDIWDQEEEAARQRAERRREDAEALEKITQIEGRLGQERVAAIQDAKDAYRDVLDAHLESAAALATSLMGLDDPLAQWNATSHATAFSELAAEVLGAGTALDTVYRVVVGNTSAFAQQADSVQSWIDGLMTWSDEQLTIHNLVAEGYIGQVEYNAALEAQGRITEANAHIQRDVLTMQALQAPLIAEQTEALEAQLHAMSSLPAEQQLVALGWMDSATAAKAMEINTLAAAVAAGELGASGEAAFQSYIEGAVAADPVLKALLIDMGLISEGANGEIVIDFASAEGAQSEIAMLTDSINALILTLGGIPPFYLEVEGMEGLRAAIAEAEAGVDVLDGANPIITIDGEDHAIPVMHGVKAVLDALNGDVATTYARTVDESSGIISAVQAGLNALHGRIATATIRTVYQTIGSPRQSDYEGLAHGGIAGYAMGGNVVPIWASENGTELAHFPTGGIVPLVGEGIHQVPVGSYIETAPSVRARGGGITINAPMIVNAPIYGVDDLNDWFTGTALPALGEEFDQYLLGQGAA
jgi:hypothetical protein